MSTRTLPIVALVGRPNVGKSSLFNRWLGERKAVIAEIAGTTRDALVEKISLAGHAFALVDLAGVENLSRHGDSEEELKKAVQAQVRKYLELATVLVWVLDGRVEPTDEDLRIASELRKLNKPIFIAVNKCDDPRHDDRQLEYARFGYDTFPVSAIHGRGTDELLSHVLSYLPHNTAAEPEIEEGRELAVCIVGRPNVGKSTLLNALAGENRSVVSAVSGTTRDPVDTYMRADRFFGNTFTKWQQVRIIDTAGIRRRGKIGHEIEAWSLVRTYRALDESEVALFLIDASEGLTHQDLQVLRKGSDDGKAMVLLVNKWDLYLQSQGAMPGSKEDTALGKEFLLQIRDLTPFFSWLPITFISAETGYNLESIGKLAVQAYTAWNRSFTVEELKKAGDALRIHPALKNVMYITVPHSRPPVFHVHVEGKTIPHFSIIRSIENKLRATLNLGPAPIKVWCVPSISTPRTGRGK
jgi:GTP-binding protein